MMETGQIITHAEIRSWAEGGDDLVAAAVMYPLPRACGCLALTMCHSVLMAELKRDGIASDLQAGMPGIISLLVISRVRDRNPAMRAYHRGLSVLGVLKFAEIGFYDSEEMIWRTVWPAKPLGPFDRFLSNERIAEGQAIIAGDARFASALLTIAQQEGKGL
jgi:hypothetical protein